MFKNRFLIVIGLLSLLLVAMAVSLPLSGVPASEAANSAIHRGREAYAARWTAMGEYYEKLEESQLQRSRAADTGRWTAMVERYQSVEEAQNLQRAQAADAARWTAMANYYLQVFGK
jgi:hypothetical protein